MVTLRCRLVREIIDGAAPFDGLDRDQVPELDQLRRRQLRT